MLLSCFINGLLWISFAASFSKTPVVIIEPNRLYCNEELNNGNTVYYHLKALHGGTGYELRISYPAVVPTEFIIKELNRTKGSERKLLNIEKLVFWTGLNEKEKYVEVTAIRVGNPVKTSLRDLPVTYDIILVRLYGGLPVNVWKVIFIILATIVIVVKFCFQPAIKWTIFNIEKLD